MLEGNLQQGPAFNDRPSSSCVLRLKYGRWVRTAGSEWGGAGEVGGTAKRHSHCNKALNLAGQSLF